MSVFFVLKLTGFWKRHILNQKRILSGTTILYKVVSNRITYYFIPFILCYVHLCVPDKMKTQGADIQKLQVNVDTLTTKLQHI